MKLTTTLLILFCLCAFHNLLGQGPPPPPGQEPFITKWRTTTPNESITIPTFPGETYNYEVNWGDGNVERGLSGDATHEYSTPGTYTVFIEHSTADSDLSIFPRIYFKNSDDPLKLIEVVQWGTTDWTSMQDAFYGCGNLDVTATDEPDLEDVSSMSGMFHGAVQFNGDITDWDVSVVSDFQSMFYGAQNFNQDLSSWNISSMTNAISMFENSGLSNANYDKILIGWATLDTNETLLQNVHLGAQTNQYCHSLIKRQELITDHGWIISDAGLNPNCGFFMMNSKVFLQGASLNPNVGEEHLMRDDLRVEGYIPTTSPYTDALTCDAAVFNTTGNDAIVDWVYVELRDANDDTTVSEGRSALLQRDGDIVDIDGTSSIIFNRTPDDYFVLVSHRNHLPIITDAAHGLGTNTTLDFTDIATLTQGNHAQTTFGMPSGILGMWAGDANGDRQVTFLNTGAESIRIKQMVLEVSATESPFGASIFYKPLGYYNEDLNLDGEVIFLNEDNESILVKNNVMADPKNFFNSVFHSIQTQLP